jgi:hypothetical protein
VATFWELANENPNIYQQYDEWRELRAQNGEDPTDFRAFRQHVVAIGAPDPGDQEPDDLVDDDLRASHAERYRTGAAQVDTAYGLKEFAELAELPIDVLRGLDAAEAQTLKKCFNVQTIRQLAEHKLVRAVQALVLLDGVPAADAEALKQSTDAGTLRQLADNKALRVAQAITLLAGPSQP